MTDKERAAIEAARKVDSKIHMADNADEVHIERLCDLRLAIQALDAEQENDMNYKWLAIDENCGTMLSETKPTWNSNYFICHEKYKIISNQPSFAKTDQLWERILPKLDCGQNVQNDAEIWNGYWWRLAEDHSTTCTRADNDCPVYPRCTEDCVERKVVEDGKPWITDLTDVERKIRTVRNELREKYYQLHELPTSRCAILSDVLSSVLDSLRVKPVEPKCEECFNHGVGANMDRVCFVNKSFGPQYGMDGCQFKRRED